MSKLIKSNALSGKIIVTFGDSMTNFCGDSYASHIAEDMELTVINAGAGGNTTYHARNRFKSDVLAHKPDLVIIAFDGNDQAIQRDNLKSLVPIEEYRANLQSSRSTPHAPSRRPPNLYLHNGKDKSYQNRLRIP